MPDIKGSVGRGGKNHRSDVLIVQSLLNDNIRPPERILAEDELIGPKTISAIERFQRRVLEAWRPDGRVDPGHRTIRSLNRLAGSMVPLPPNAGPIDVATPMKKNKQQLRQFFADKQRKPSEWTEFWKLIVEDATPEVKRFFSMIGRAEDARKIAEFYVRLREMGTSPKEIKQILEIIAGYKNPRWTKDFVEFLAEPQGPAGKFLKKLSDAGKIVGFVVFVVEYVNHWSNGDYHMAIVEIYKYYMGEAIPWAGYVDTLQSFAGAVLPKSMQTDTVYKCLKALNPIDLGAQGIDAAGVMITMVVEGKLSDKRLDRLAKRMKTGSTAIFYEIGDDLAKALDSIAGMSDSEFDEMMSAENLWGWLNDFWLTKYTPSLVLYRWIKGLLSD